MSVCAYMPPGPLRETAWAAGGSRAHRRQPPQAVFPGSLLGQVCLLHGCTCPPVQAPSMEGMSQRPPGKCLMSHQTCGKRLARLSLNLVSPPSRKHSPSQSRVLQQHAAPFPASRGQARMPVQPPPLKDRSHRYHTRPGIHVNSVLRIEAKHEGSACLLAAADSVLPNLLGPPLRPFRLGPHQCLTHTDDLRRHIYFFIIVS